MAENAQFRKDACSNVVLSEKQFSECTFINGAFLEEDFSNKSFVSCLFRRCNLHLVNMTNTRLQDVLFIECKIVAIQFFLCGKRFFSPNFENCSLLGCNFSDLAMLSLKFLDSKIENCFFQEANLTKACFKGSDLSGTIFHHTNLSEADFRNASNYAIDPRVNCVKKARFSTPEALSLLQAFDISIF